MTNEHHTPVLLHEVVALVTPPRPGLLVDGTVGSGGHALELLRRAPAGSRLLGVDRDPSALVESARRLVEFGDRVELVRGRFSAVPAMMADRGGAKAIGILLDLGLRSSQVDRPERGFSYLEDGPLDMRMEEGTGPTAERLLSEADRPTLVRVLREGGEEPRAPRIARGILEARERGGLATTRDLARAVEAAVPRRDRIRSLARTFQAVRIWVNRELEELDAFLAEAPEMLEEEGVLCVISYHSLEDRRVKRAMRGWARGCICPPQAPECRCGRSPEVELLTRRVKVPSAGEKARNPRSRSAKLRACRRIRGGGDEKR